MSEAVGIAIELFSLPGLKENVRYSAIVVEQNTHANRLLNEHKEACQPQQSLFLASSGIKEGTFTVQTRDSVDDHWKIGVGPNEEAVVGFSSSVRLISSFGGGTLRLILGHCLDSLLKDALFMTLGSTSAY